MRARRYEQRKDGEAFEVPHDTPHRIACCDCGLVHDFRFLTGDASPVVIVATRNARATAQRRRSNEKKT